MRGATASDEMRLFELLGSAQGGSQDIERLVSTP
jgi:hypothetical protein